MKGRTEAVPEARAADSTEEALIDPATELPAPEEERAGGDGGAAGLEKAAEIEKLKAERDALAERLARLQAEFDNARKRAEREQVEFRDYAMGSVVEKFLPVMDNFQLALKSTGSVNQLRSGVDLIVKQMDEVLRQMQVTPIATVGEPFDPRVHEALGTVERDDIPDQHVAEEIRRGYKVRERLLRPAMVKVAHNAKQVRE